MFSAPTVATITSDGAILILEAGNNRIHAVDGAGNPVRHFSNQPEPYFLNLSETGGGDTEYLDIAVEFGGFIYVLSSSSSNSVYRLDIYTRIKKEPPRFVALWDSMPPRLRLTIFATSTRSITKS